MTLQSQRIGWWQLTARAGLISPHHQPAAKVVSYQQQAHQLDTQHLPLRDSGLPDRFVFVFPDDSQKELGTVLSYLAGRRLSTEEIWKAMELPRSTYYDQLDKGTLINADNLRRAAANLGINRAELLTRYRLIHPDEVLSLAAVIGGRHPGVSPEAAASRDVLDAAVAQQANIA